MSLLSWLRGRRKRDEAKRESPEQRPVEGGIDSLRADQLTTLASGITPEEAARLAERDDE